MSRTKLLTSSQQPLTVLAVLLLLCGMVLSGTAHAQGQSQTLPCMRGVELQADLAGLDLDALQAALQGRIDDNPDATVTLLFNEGEQSATIRADLLAEEAALAALLEGQPVKLTGDFSRAEEGLIFISDFGVSMGEDCTFFYCEFGLGLPPTLAGLDVAGLRAALEEMIAADADAVLTVTALEPVIVRADLLLGLADPVLASLLAGDVLSVTQRLQGDTFEIIRVSIPGSDCFALEPGGEEPEPGDIQDDQQGGDIVTKTLRLTLTGDPPPGTAFFAAYGDSVDQEAGASFLVFCGDPREENLDTGPLEPQPACEPGVYSRSVEIVAGTIIEFAFFRTAPDEFEVVHSGIETLDDDMTNTAFYIFEQKAGTGEVQDDEQDTGKDTDGDIQADQQVAGKGADDQQVNTQDYRAVAGDDQQDDVDKDSRTGVGNGQQFDIEDDQRVEVPEELPETGMGGLAPGRVRRAPTSLDRR